MRIPPNWICHLLLLTKVEYRQPLARSNHTLTTVGDKAYLFFGELPNGELCSPKVHVIALPSPDTKSSSTTKHLSYEPFPLRDSETGEAYLPTSRAEHAACARGKYVIIHGGRDAHGNPIEEDNCLWLWDTVSLSWAKLQGEVQIGKTMAPRYGHSIFVDPTQDFLVLHGGHTQKMLQKPDKRIPSTLSNANSDTATETWLYDFKSRSWTALPSSPASPVATAYTDTALYTISRATDAQSLSGVVNYLKMQPSPTEREKPGALAWKTVTFPTNPLTPGPKPREGGALIPLSTGHGRNYLVYMFGCDDSHNLKHKDDSQSLETPFYADIWSLQIPSYGYSAAAAKDKIRDKLRGMDSGQFTWAAAELVPTEQMQSDGKVHPGPRASFGADSCFDGKGAVLWGGVNAKGETEGDGWVLGLAYGYADHDRWE